MNELLLRYGLLYGLPPNSARVKTNWIMRSADNRLAFPADGLCGLARYQGEIERYADPILDAVVEAVRGVLENL